MGVTVLPYIDQTQTARLQEAASANIQTPKNTDEAVTTFKECLASAERSVQAMAVDALLAASNSGAVSLDTVQQILGFTPQTDAPVVPAFQSYRDEPVPLPVYWIFLCTGIFP